jgi:hypothetical protein
MFASGRCVVAQHLFVIDLWMQIHFIVKKYLKVFNLNEHESETHLRMIIVCDDDHRSRVA